VKLTVILVLLHALDYDAVVREVESIRKPAIVEQALYVNALALLQAKGRASAAAAKLRKEHPSDPWSWYAATVAAQTPADALSASEKMMALAGDHADGEMIRARARSLYDAHKRDEAFALLDRQPRTAFMLVARATLLSFGVSPSELDPRVFELLEESRKLEPENVEALTRAGALLRFQGRTAEALPLLAKAAALTRAARVQREYWTALRSQKRDEVPAAIEALLAQDSGPALLLAAADTYYALGDKQRSRELQERILREAPGSMSAQWVLSDRYAKAPREEALAAARAYVAWPQQYEPMMEASGYRLLFFALRDDPHANESELLTAIRRMRMAASLLDLRAAAIALADRKLALGEAETLARSSAPDLLHDTLGWVLLQRGKMREAEKELIAAWELKKTPDIAFHVGRFYESEHKLAQAEEIYRKGLALPMNRGGVNPNSEPLRNLYKQRVGSLDGFEESLKAAVDARKNKILSARTGTPMPSFELRTLDGRTVSQTELAGKIGVIHFWGIWCAPCVHEMPAFQQLAKKYEGDDRVVVVTMNTDDDAEKVRRWMAEQHYQFLVLLAERWAWQHVGGYPTTWFLAPSGQITFEQRGMSENLIEEFSWRIEALR
jgi:thiol-disulfide isomerase/thioredoxin